MAEKMRKIIFTRGKKITYFGILFHEEVFYLERERDRERERERKLHLINLHGAHLFPVSRLSSSINETFSLCLLTM